MTFQDRRLWIGGGVVAALLVVIASWFLAISPELSSADSVRGEADSAQTQNVTAQAKLNRLQQKSEHKDELVATLRSALAALPPDDGLSDLTRQLTAQATLSGVGLTSVTVGTSTAANSATPAPAGAAAPQTGLLATQVTLVTNGKLAQQLAFLHLVQIEGPRRALVTSAQFTPADSGGSTGSIDGTSTATLSLTVFSEPQNAQQRAQLAKLLSGDLTR
jgi:hypothetical protein